RASGVRYLFGNPGTTELPFLDALPDSALEYIVALQEATAVAAADGYAQATGRVGLVNLHVLPGVANGISILHNASRARSPIVVTAGQQDTRLLLDEPILSGDMVRLTEQFTKWSYEVRRADEAPVAVAERLGARVHGEPIYRRTVFPGDHALWRGGLFPTVPAVRKALDNADAVLVVGASMFTWFLHAPGTAIPPELPLVQIGDD